MQTTPWQIRGIRLFVRFVISSAQNLNHEWHECINGGWLPNKICYFIYLQTLNLGIGTGTLKF